MPNTPFSQSLRDEISELIREAVGEPDFARRLALLTTADHWNAVLTTRGARGGARSGPRPA